MRMFLNKLQTKIHLDSNLDKFVNCQKQCTGFTIFAILFKDRKTILLFKGEKQFLWHHMHEKKKPPLIKIPCNIGGNVLNMAICKWLVQS